MHEDDETIYEEVDVTEIIGDAVKPNLTIEYAMYMIGFIRDNPNEVPYPVQGAVWDYIKRFFNEDIT